MIILGLLRGALGIRPGPVPSGRVIVRGVGEPALVGFQIVAEAHRLAEHARGVRLLPAQLRQQDVFSVRDCQTEVVFDCVAAGDVWDRREVFILGVECHRCGGVGLVASLACVQCDTPVERGVEGLENMEPQRFRVVGVVGVRRDVDQSVLTQRVLREHEEGLVVLVGAGEDLVGRWRERVECAELDGVGDFVKHAEVPIARIAGSGVEFKRLHRPVLGA